MTAYDTDILIVGAGPAGSSAARAACGRGLRVLMVERRAVVGRPVQCAEYIPAPLLKEAGIGRDFVVQPVGGMTTVLPDGDIKETRAPGCTIHRDLFDQALARKAVEAGTELRVSTRALSWDGDAVMVGDKKGLASRVRAKVIIGADGPHSRVGRWIGSINGHMIPAIQVTLPLVQPMDRTEVYFDKAFFGGYGWLFPKGPLANVGIGKLRQAGDVPIVASLKRFISRLEREGKVTGRPVRSVAGWIPAEAPRKVSTENILLAGDAAGHTHPITGAGVSQAVLCGRMAGKWAARAAESGDLTLLSGYEREWREFIGESQERAFQRRQVLESKWEHLEETIKTCWVAFREYYAQA